MLSHKFRSAATASAIALSSAGLAACASTGASAPTQAQAAQTARISEQEVLKAQDAWCKALVTIATTYDEKGLDAARNVASGVIDAAYGYNLGPVLFKPTLTVAPQTFRTTREGALAYFVGSDSRFPSDSGFALKGWRSCASENAGIFIDDDVAISMGKVRMTDKAGKVTEVDKTWGWKKDAKGDLRIVLHHSSLPYSPS